MKFDAWGGAVAAETLFWHSVFNAKIIIIINIEKIVQVNAFNFICALYSLLYKFYFLLPVEVE